MHWNGYDDALKSLFSLILGFERHISLEAIIETRQNFDIGDFGLSWTWSGKKETPENILFLRKNVVVVILGQLTQNLEIKIAKEIDNQLKELQPAEKYSEEKRGMFSRIKKEKGEIPKVPAGERLTIGENPIKAEQLFFTTTTGSINRNPNNPDEWYFRASLEKGNQEITLYRIANGLLPKKEKLSVEII